VYFKMLANSANPEETLRELREEQIKIDNPEDPRSYAISVVDRWWDQTVYDEGRAMALALRSDKAEQLSNQTLLELQADIGAAVAMNLIPRTPEIDALLAPLHDLGDDGKTLKRDLTNIIDRVAPLEMPKREDVEKVKARKLFGSLIMDLTRIAQTDFDKRVQEARDRGLLKSGRAEEVEQRGLSSTAMFSGRRSMSKWAGSLRESIMDSATPEQKKVIESDWRKKPWSKPATTEVVSFNLSMDIDGSRTVAMLDKELIPFADLIEKSKLPNGVAVEVLLPDGSMGVPGNNIDGARFAISHHFTGILKSEDDLGAVGIVDTNARKFSGFETSLSNEPGSRYSYNRDGKVTRKKPSTGSSITDSDTTSTFDNTVFVSQKDQEALRFAFERGRGLSEDGELIGLDYDETTRDTAEYLRLRKEYLRSGMDAYEATDKAFVDSGGTINERVIVPETEPKIGLNVFEWDNDNGTRHHPGNKVRKITKRSEREQGVMGPTSGTQRVIVNVPEGFSGLPDFTPGTDKSEVGSIILPPGELEVVGRLSDGTVMARVTSQSNAVESLAPFESALRQISQSNRESLTQKANAQKALRKIETRKTAARIMATRLASGRKPTDGERDTTVIPDEITPSNRVIKERMKSQNITFGKRQTQQLQKKRNAYLEKIQASRRGGGIVATDDHRFESPEEAQVRVDNIIDDAFQHIKVGKLPYLSPEVSEIMRGKSKDEIKKILAEAIRKQIKGLDKRIRFRIRGESMSGIKDSRESPLMGFIKRGRYMTTHQDTGSQASSLAENRIESELLLGIPETADDSLRPAHGYMLHVDEVEFIKRAKKDRASKMKPQDGDEVDIDVLMPTPGGAFGSVNTFEGKVVDSLAFQYGSSEIVLKPEIAQRAVLTFGDSFNGMRTPVGFDGSETDDELLAAALLQRAGALGGGLFSNSSLDTQQRRIANLLEASVADNYAHVTDVSTPGYAGAVGSEQRYYNEGIVAGGFGMDDVEEIRIDEGFQRQHMREHKVSPKTVDGNTIREYFGPYITKQDAELIVEILENKDKKYPAAMVSDLREQIAFRAEAIGKLRERQRIRTLIAESLKDPQNMPKVTFLRYDGVNDDVHSFYPRSMEISGMTEEHELVDVVGYGSVKIIREFLSEWGANIAPETEMDALKPRKSSDKLGSPKRLASGRGQVAKREPSRIDRRLASGRIDENEKPQYPRKPSYGPILGDANKIFKGVKDWEDFQKRYNDVEVTFLDYETTGLKFDEFNFSTGNGEVTQIGAVKVKDGKVTKRFETYVNPGIPRSDWEQWSRDNLKDYGGNLVTDEFLQNKPSVAEAHRRLAEFIGPNAIMGVQNAAFDKDVLEDALKKHGIDFSVAGWIDLKDMASMVLPRYSDEKPDGPFKFNKKLGKNVPSNSLADITKYLKVELGDKHHTADADAEATAESMRKLIEGAIKNKWSTDVLDETNRKNYVTKQQERFDKDITAFETAKADYVQRQKSGRLASGRRGPLDYEELQRVDPTGENLDLLPTYPDPLAAEINEDRQEDGDIFPNTEIGWRVYNNQDPRYKFPRYVARFVKLLKHYNSYLQGGIYKTEQRDEKYDKLQSLMGFGGYARSGYVNINRLLRLGPEEFASVRLQQEIEEARARYKRGVYDDELKRFVYALPEGWQPPEGLIEREIAKASKQIAHIDSIIKDSPPLEEPITVFRGITSWKVMQMIDEAGVGGIITEKGFMSTSVSPVPLTARYVDYGGEQAPQNSKWETWDMFSASRRGDGGWHDRLRAMPILKILVPAGARGTITTALKPDDDGDGHDWRFDSIQVIEEAEFLLPRGTKLKIVSIGDGYVTAEVVLDSAEAIRNDAETLLEELGPRVKSERRSLDKRAVPQPSALRSMFPFIINEEEKQ